MNSNTDVQVSPFTLDGFIDYLGKKLILDKNLSLLEAYKFSTDLKNACSPVDIGSDWYNDYLKKFRSLIKNDDLFIFTCYVLSDYVLSVLPLKKSEDRDIPFVRRRNGDVVVWMPNKIKMALQNAASAGSIDKVNLNIILDTVTESVNRLLLSRDLLIIDIYIIHAAIIHSLYVLMNDKAYGNDARILMLSYISALIDKNNIVSQKYVYSGKNKRLEALRLKVHYALEGLDCACDFTEEELLNILTRHVDNVSYSSFDVFRRPEILNSKFLTEYGYDYSVFAGRLFLLNLYEAVIGWDIIKHGIERLNDYHRTSFPDYVKRAVKLGLLDKRLLELYDLDELAGYLDYRNDWNSSIMSIKILYDRYLLSYMNKSNRIILEVPQFFWMRVAMGQFILDEKRSEYVPELFRMYVSKRFCSSTPTLFNSGTLRPQMSSCYVYVVDDSIESIFQRGIADCAYLSKYAGGLGGSWTKVRGRGAVIKGTQGKSNGVIPFLKIHNDMLLAVNQGGKRNGSGAVYLEVWHYDIYDFLYLRRNTGDERMRTHETNTAVWIPDLFMKKVMNREKWYLFQPNEVPDLPDLYGKKFEERYEYYVRQYLSGKIQGREVEAIDLWREILMMLYETGHPWITFKDPCNIANPQSHAGVIYSSNLCTEITLNTNEKEIAVCNLGSIMLDYHTKELLHEDNKVVTVIDYDKLAETIRIAIRALDNVIDVNFYPVSAAEYSNKRHRPIGLGVAGWHNLLFKLGIAFDSPEALQLSNDLFEFISYHATLASIELAREKGKYETYEGSKWSKGILTHETVLLIEQERGMSVNLPITSVKQDWQKVKTLLSQYGIRNSHITAIAPTATISNIMDTSPSIEPLFSNLYVKSNLSGDFFVINRYLERYLRLHNAWQEFRDRLKYFDGDAIQAADMIRSRISEEVYQYIVKHFKTAYQISQRVIIEQASVRQRWVTQSQSVNIFYSGNSAKELSDIYKYAWQCGLKTTYYLRTIGATRIEKSTVERNSEIVPGSGYCSLDNPECDSCQ